VAITLYSARVLTPSEVIDNASIVASDTGLITYVGPTEGAPRLHGLRLDMRNRIVVPGFIDVHVHGGKGITLGGSLDIGNDLQAYSNWVASNGVTGFLCSIAAPDAPGLVEMVKIFAEELDKGVSGAEALGLHLEGPFINVEKKGAFNSSWLRAPSVDEARAVLEVGRGWIRQVTMAPELPGVKDVENLFRAQGVVVSLGHSNADYARARAALRGNYTHVTHTFNAQRGFHHREPGVSGAVMASDEVTAELIADTVHVHPGAMKALWRCLGTERVVLITDAMAGAGLADGVYELLGHTVTVTDGTARLADGTIAGSTAVLNECVRNVRDHAGVPLAAAVQMASLNPARAIGLACRLGSIALEKDASLTVIDDDLNVSLSMVRGEIVYQDWYS